MDHCAVCITRVHVFGGSRLHSDRAHRLLRYHGVARPRRNEVYRTRQLYKADHGRCSEKRLSFLLALFSALSLIGYLLVALAWRTMADLSENLPDPDAVIFGESRNCGRISSTNGVSICFLCIVLNNCHLAVIRRSSCMRWFGYFGNMRLLS